METSHPKIAIVADWITHWGGAERILVKLMEMYPEAEIYTSVFFPERSEAFEGRKIHTSFIQYIPFLNRRHKLCMLLRPMAFRSFDFSEYDLVISSSSAEAKGIRLQKVQSTKYKVQNGGFGNNTANQQLKHTVHICYCHTPTRYLWSHSEAYRNFLEFGGLNWLAKLIIPPAFKMMKKWDYGAAQRPDVFIANSLTTQARIAEYYHRESVVVYPFFQDKREKIKKKREGLLNNGENAPLIKGGRGDFLSLDSTSSSQAHLARSPKYTELQSEIFEGGTGMTGYFVCLGRIVPYKRFDLAIEACNQLGWNLKIFTNTKNAESERLQKLSGPTIEWIFGASDSEVGEGLHNAEGFIMPQVEDFGIVALEAMSHGIPVIAYGEGGATETVIHGKTGLLFSEQTIESLVSALKKSREVEWDSGIIREQSMQFSEERFEEEFRKVVEEVST